MIATATPSDAPMRAAAHPNPTPVRLTFADRVLSLAMRLAIRLAGYRVRFAIDDGERHRACRLRQSVYARDVGRTHDVEPDPCPDRYDRGAHHIVALHRGRLVGTARLVHSHAASVILDTAEVELPAGVKLSETFEFGGLAISEHHRGRGRIAMLGMLDLAYRYSLGQGRTYWFCLFHRRQMRAFTAFHDRIIELDALLREDHRLPGYLAARIVRRWTHYACVLIDLRGASYVRNLQSMLRGALRRMRAEAGRSRSGG